MKSLIRRETLLQRMRRHYERQSVRMSRYTPGQFLLLKSDTVIGKIEDVEESARALGVLKPYEIVKH